MSGGLGETLLRGGRRAAAADLSRYVAEIGEAHRRAVAELVASHRFRSAPPDVRIVKGDPAQAPMQDEVAARARLLVVGAPAGSVVRHARGSVLVIRPP